MMEMFESWQGKTSPPECARQYRIENSIEVILISGSPRKLSSASKSPCYLHSLCNVFSYLILSPVNMLQYARRLISAPSSYFCLPIRKPYPEIWRWCRPLSV